MKKLLAIVMVATSMTSCNKNDTKVTSYMVNESVSKAEWKGSAPDHFHVGSFKVTGTLSAKPNGEVIGGDFVMPISSIEDYDLPDPVRQTLLEDLKSSNFFNLVIHPNAKFHITKVAAHTTKDTGAVADANYLMTGDFTMVGQTHPITFPAKISMSADSLLTEAKFDLDRTKWGMNIYSDPSKPLYIKPNVNMHLKIHSVVSN